MVDGLLASDQSEWVLDDVVPAAWRRHLSALYGAVLAPLRGLYAALGPRGMLRLDAALAISWWGHHYGHELLVQLPAALAAVAAAAWAGRQLISRCGEGGGVRAL